MLLNILILCLIFFPFSHLHNITSKKTRLVLIQNTEFIIKKFKIVYETYENLIYMTNPEPNHYYFYRKLQYMICSRTYIRDISLLNITIAITYMVQYRLTNTITQNTDNGKEETHEHIYIYWFFCFF